MNTIMTLTFTQQGPSLFAEYSLVLHQHFVQEIEG